jgi:hypothetical protein
MRSVSVIAMAALAALAARTAEAQSFEQLQGKSIILSYDESLRPTSGGPLLNHWEQTVYISTNGNIFLRQKFLQKSGKDLSSTSTDQFDTMGDRGGVGEGERTKYQWNGSALTRSWPGRAGVRITQAIIISGGGCHSSIERSGFNGEVTVALERCHIVNGNALAGR